MLVAIVFNGHSSHCAAPAYGAAQPGAQAVHDSAPYALENEPTGQGAHATDPLALLYVPGKHTAQPDAPDAENPGNTRVVGGWYPSSVSVAFQKLVSLKLESLPASNREPKNTQLKVDPAPPKSVSTVLVTTASLASSSTTDAFKLSTMHDGQFCFAVTTTLCTYTGRGSRMLSQAWSLPELENAVPILPSLMAGSNCVLGHWSASMDVGAFLYALVQLIWLDEDAVAPLDFRAQFVPLMSSTRKRRGGGG